MVPESSHGNFKVEVGMARPFMLFMIRGRAKIGIAVVDPGDIPPRLTSRNIHMILDMRRDGST